VVVGTLVDRRDGGLGHFGPPGAIYTVQVESWVKGNAGEVIEIHSGQGDGDCGISGNLGDRLGAFLRSEGDVLTGNSCEQIDPDVLLAAMEGPTVSTTGVGHLLVANGWSSTRLTVLDEVGDTVTDLFPETSNELWVGTQALDLCPGMARMLQTTSHQVVVWDLNTMKVESSHDLTDLLTDQWVSDVVCRSEDASSIWLLLGGELTTVLVEVVPEPTTISQFDAGIGYIGHGYVVLQHNSEGDATWVDLDTDVHTQLTAIPQGELRSISLATHPARSQVAVLETQYRDDGPVTATLSVFDGPSTRLAQFEIPFEAYSPTWLDENRVFVQAYDFDNSDDSSAYVFDVTTGRTVTVAGWNAQTTIAEGSTLYGVSGGDVIQGDLETGVLETLVTLATESAGPLVLLQDAPRLELEPVQPPAPEPTTPPMVAPELGIQTPDATAIRWVAGIAMFSFLGMLVWLGLRRPKPPDRS